MDFDLNLQLNGVSVRMIPAFEGQVLKDFYKCFHDIFIESYPESGLDSFENIAYTIHKRKETTIPFLGYIDNKPAVFRYLRYSKDTGISYVPWGGIILEYRGKGIYPLFCKESEVILKESNQKIIVNECENPNIVEDKQTAISRLKMFVNKLNFNFVSDENISYARNEWSSDIEDTNVHQRIDRNYILGFKIIDEELEKKVIRNNRILKSEYIKLYFAIRDFEFDFEKELYISLPATKQFIKSIETDNNEYINLVDNNKL